MTCFYIRFAAARWHKNTRPRARPARLFLLAVLVASCCIAHVLVSSRAPVPGVANSAALCSATPCFAGCRGEGAVLLCTFPALQANQSFTGALSPPEMPARGLASLASSVSAVQWSSVVCRARRSPGDPGGGTLRLGEAANPGPPIKAGVKNILSANVTALMPAIPIIAASGADVIAFQEHSLPLHQREPARRLLSKAGYSAVFSCTDPESSGISGGVGLAVKKPLGSQACQPNTVAFKEAAALGRATLALVALGSHFPVLVCSFYAWHTPHKDPLRLARTASLMQAVLDEVATWPLLPAILLGDLNTTPDKVESVSPRLLSQEWHDVGMRAEAWGGLPNQATAWAHNARAPSRLDCILVNSPMLQHIRSFRHHGFGQLDVHAMISIGILTGKPNPCRQLMSPKPLDLSSAEPEAVAAHIDRHFIREAHSLDRLLAMTDLTGFFQLWSACMERGLAEAAGSHVPPAAPHRGQPCIRCVPPQWARAVQVHPDSPEEAMAQLPVHGKLLITKRRLNHMIGLARASRPVNGASWSKDLCDVWAAIVTNFSTASDLGIELPP